MEFISSMNESNITRRLDFIERGEKTVSIFLYHENSNLNLNVVYDYLGLSRSIFLVPCFLCNFVISPIYIALFKLLIMLYLLPFLFPRNHFLFSPLISEKFSKGENTHPYIIV